MVASDAKGLFAEDGDASTLSELAEIRPSSKLLLQFQARWSYVGGDQQGVAERRAASAVFECLAQPACLLDDCHAYMVHAMLCTSLH